MSRIPKPHLGIMAVIVPFVILLLVLIAIEPSRACGFDAPAPPPALTTPS